MLNSEQIAQGWKEHDGSTLPMFELPQTAWIEVAFRGEADPAKGVLRTYGFPGQYAWHHDGAEDDIIAYREVPHD